MTVKAQRGRAARKSNGRKANGDDDGHRTDTGNARRMVGWYKDRILYCPAHKAWYIWDGRIWARDDLQKMMLIAKATVERMLVESVEIIDRKEREAMIRWCFTSESTGKLKAMIENAQSEVAVAPTELDADPFLLCVENGTINLKVGKLQRHNPADLITLMAPVEYDPDAVDGRWEEVLDRFVRPDEGKEAFLQRAAFASFTGTTSDKAFINLYDDMDGNTGKTTFVESLLATLGPYGATVNAESFLLKAHGSHGIRADLAACYGKRMVVSSEIPVGRHLDEALMKKLTSGFGSMQWERKYENPWEGPITFTPWLDGNTVAKAPAEDTPLFDRWKLPPFKHKFVGTPDRRWLEKAAADPAYRAAVLAWVMDAREPWWKGGMGSAPSVDVASAEVRAAMDPMAEFWREECRFGRDRAGNLFFTSSKQLRIRRVDWAARQPGKRHAINDQDFYALLKAKKVKPGTKRINGKVVRGWHGVKLRQ